jgi:hypothetical protein
MPNLLQDGFPHLDAVVSALTPVYRDDIPFRCTSVKDRGTREALSADRECEWMVAEPFTYDGAPHFARFRTPVVLRLRVDVKAREDDARLEAHVLARGLVTSFLAADYAGVPATTGINVVIPDPEALVNYTLIEAEEGPPLAVVAEVGFIIIEGDC